MSNHTAGELFDNKNPIVIAVIGCGGKTSLIESIAYEFRHKKVLVTPTTKIMPMDGEDVILNSTLTECSAHVPSVGIQCFGLQNNVTGKFGPLPLDILAKIIGQYDVILLEADGSRGLPCKGWLSTEPVIPDFCTHTVGVVTLNALGKPATEDIVLRLPEFLKLTGLEAEQPITLQALTHMVCSDEGMFYRAVGKKYLFVNQVEDDYSASIATDWLNKIKFDYPETFSRLAFGSARANNWKEI